MDIRGSTPTTSSSPLPCAAFAHSPSNTYVTIEGKRIPIEALWDRDATSNTADDEGEDSESEEDTPSQYPETQHSSNFAAPPTDVDAPHFCDQPREQEVSSNPCTCEFSRTCERCIRLAQSRHGDDAHSQCIRQETKKNDEHFRQIGAYLYPDYAPYNTSDGHGSKTGSTDGGKGESSRVRETRTRCDREGAADTARGI
ncbi:hypothetical protein NLJ89_g4391 [Agrocybe chaxingu]|uniref:Uncharacterized protein n=1 Tax=Agrocybe chaxingu TaxID=84603 RepID=A0A9W8K282_9AGAR|nr:hypothetical protein NLJ89_g4391 [Agrocybe chaxingu]